MSSQDNKPTVLLIDDSADVHRLLSARLRHDPISLQCAQSGEEGLEIATSNPPAVILLDLDMPGMDGFQVLRALMDNPETHSIPVIVLSGMHASQDKVSAFDLGATDYVTKPFELTELKARLRAALRLHHLLRLLAERAEVDGLTGLGDRRSFDRHWAKQVAESSRYGRPLALALFDIDHFKNINDTYGHPTGDEVIQSFAAQLAACCRESDVPCRYGGEEFALIMPSTSAQDAATVAERVRESFANTTWPRHGLSGITVSAGIAGTATGAKDFTAEQWIEAADQCLYTAKRSGRNRVVTRDLDGPAPRLAKAG